MPSAMTLREIGAAPPSPAMLQEQYRRPVPILDQDYKRLAATAADAVTDVRLRGVSRPTLFGRLIRQLNIETTESTPMHPDQIANLFWAKYDAGQFLKNQPPNFLAQGNFRDGADYGQVAHVLGISTAYDVVGEAAEIYLDESEKPEIESFRRNPDALRKDTIFKWGGRIPGVTLDFFTREPRSFVAFTLAEQLRGTIPGDTDLQRLFHPQAQANYARLAAEGKIGKAAKPLVFQQSAIRFCDVGGLQYS